MTGKNDPLMTASKKLYHNPQLQDHGSIHELTKASLWGNHSDGVSGYFTYRGGGGGGTPHPPSGS